VQSVDYMNRKEGDYMKGMFEPEDKTPEEKLAIAKIQVMMEDAFGLFSSISGSLTASQKKNMMEIARSWFDTADCVLWCDMAGTTHDRVKKLLGVLTERYDSNSITKDELRLGIRRLEKKI